MIASATFIPSIAAEVIPPAYPAFTTWIDPVTGSTDKVLIPFNSYREEVRLSTPDNNASLSAKP